MKASILVVDDEEHMRRLCGRVLCGMGQEPVLAASVSEASGELKTMPGLDLLLTDLRLSDGHGLDVIREARALFPGSAVLVMTAFPDADGRLKELGSEGVAEEDIIYKPFDIASLERLVAAKLACRPDGV